MPDSIAVYVHVPFCPSKCGYCDFNSYAMEGGIIPRTVAAIESEIRNSPIAGRPAKTIFFGGGTPTFLEADALNSLLRAVIETHPPVGEIEITSEANPGTVDASKFAAMREAGFNRVSLGAQSFVPSELKVLGRIHSYNEIGAAVAAARSAGFDNVNLDLMFALPSQTRCGWTDNLRRAIELAPEHLSLYCLTIEPNTAFYKQNLRGELPLPDEDRQTEMFELTMEVAEQAGYRQYEISNFAKPGMECRHNLCYWRGEEYAGYGPGAVGRVGMRRATKWKHPERYCEAVETGANLECEGEDLDERTLRTEQIMLGLRLNDGLDASLVSSGIAQRLRERGWLESDRQRIRLTKLGRSYCSDATLALL